MTLRLAAGSDAVAAIAGALAGGDPVVPLAPGADAPGFAAAPDEHAPDLALVVGTSGSTGAPKGVCLSRPALAAAAAAAHERLGGPGAWTCPLPLHFVAGAMTIVRAWHAGLPVSVVPGDLSSLPLVPGVRNYASVVVAQLHRGLADPATRAGLARYDAVLVGGSAAGDVAAAARAAGIHAVATYGMSETCGGCVYDGMPLGGVDVEVDADGRIWLAGPLLFDGYRHDPDATAAALVDGRLRTHDRGRLDEGRLRVLGRLDEVVISGGVNVDLAAAQRIADRTFGPDRVVLLAMPDERWGARIVAVTADGLELDGVRARLGADLSPAALPRELRRLPGLPRTATGKIDRPRLVREWAEGSASWPR